MNGKLVFVHAVKRMTETVQTVLERTGTTQSDIDLYFFPSSKFKN